VAKLDLGTKRVCPNCGTKYYDLNKDPIVCPKCGTHFEAPARSRSAPAVLVEEAVKPLEEAPADVEFISLEEADEEAGGAAEDEEEVEIAGQGEDPFLEDEDEEGDDVTSIIGDVDDDEEP
jgi:uncharacterized protein (TIGR02300 family)